MKWFRSNIRQGSRLALVAMLVQLALTFGHSHGVARAAPLAAVAQQQGGTGSVAAAGRTLAQKPSPAGPDREHSGDDICAICALVAMASSIVSATPPLLLLPQAYELLYLTTDAEFVHLKPVSHAFQPRAPPAS